MLHRRTKKKRMYQCLFWDIKRPQESSSCFSGLLSGMRVPLELFPPARPPRPLSQSKRASHHRPLPPPSPPTHSPPCSKSSQVEQVGNGGRGAILLAPAPTATATATEAPTPLLAVGRRMGGGGSKQPKHARGSVSVLTERSASSSTSRAWGDGRCRSPPIRLSYGLFSELFLRTGQRNLCVRPLLPTQRQEAERRGLIRTRRGREDNEEGEEGGMRRLVAPVFHLLVWL